MFYPENSAFWRKAFLQKHEPGILLFKAVAWGTHFDHVYNDINRDQQAAMPQTSFTLYTYLPLQTIVRHKRHSKWFDLKHLSSCFISSLSWFSRSVFCRPAADDPRSVDPRPLAQVRLPPAPATPQVRAALLSQRGKRTASNEAAAINNHDAENDMFLAIYVSFEDAMDKNRKDHHDNNAYWWMKQWYSKNHHILYNNDNNN